ncbi:MAG: hypothetical protein LBT45_02415 [Rickettsiales bacterium]|jgi:hypothetical protein|nr:hypothetical protein [Rickettsiales bacterium]
MAEKQIDFIRMPKHSDCKYWTAGVTSSGLLLVGGCRCDDVVKQLGGTDIVPDGCKEAEKVHLIDGWHEHSLCQRFEWNDRYNDRRLEVQELISSVVLNICACGKNKEGAR